MVAAVTEHDDLWKIHGDVHSQCLSCRGIRFGMTERVDDTGKWSEHRTQTCTRTDHEVVFPADIVAVISTCYTRSARTSNMSWIFFLCFFILWWRVCAVGTSARLRLRTRCMSLQTHIDWLLPCNWRVGESPHTQCLHVAEADANQPTNTPHVR